LTASVFAGELPQALFAITEILPEVNTELLIDTVIELELDVPVIPAGNVQV
jgi:hypothetical protein